MGGTATQQVRSCVFTMRKTVFSQQWCCRSLQALVVIQDAVLLQALAAPKEEERLQVGGTALLL